ncbi:MAG: hypothetical protein ACE5JL_13175 [Dehalococcoidia bacterium]
MTQESLREVGPFEIEITPDMVRRWAGATYDKPLKSAEKGALAPPALLFWFTMMLRRDPNAPPREGDDAVQSTYDMETYRPIKVGEKLTLSGRLVRRYIKREREYSVWDIRFQDEAGREVARYQDEGLETYRKVGER